MRKPTRRGVLAAIGFAFALGPLAPHAQSDYPNKAIKLVAGARPGDVTDKLARVVALKLGERLGQAVNVENVEDERVAADQVAKAAPDGYTLVLGTTGSHAIAPTTARLPYDPVNDFTHISRVAITPGLLVTSTKTPAANLQGFVTLARNHPTKMKYGSEGILSQLWMEILKDEAKLEMHHTPYRRDAEYHRAIIAGEADAGFSSLRAWLENVQAGKVRPIAVGAAKRSPALPEVPTFAEQGYPAFEFSFWLGVMGPAKMPRPIVERLHRELVAIVAMPEFVAAIAGSGVEPVSSATPQEFTDMLRGQVDTYVRITKAAGIKIY